MNKEALERSVFLIGPAGVGKSLHARELSKKTGMPVVTLDMMRHCKDLRALESHRGLLEDKLAVNKVLVEKTQGEERIEHQREGAQFRRDYDRACAQIAFRKLLPNVPDYTNIPLAVGTGKAATTYRLHFNDVMAEGIMGIAAEHNEDPHVAWHYYQKPFEIALVQNVIKNISQPMIIDFGGGMPIVLEDQYKAIEAHAMRLGTSQMVYRGVFPFTPEELSEALDETFSAIPKQNIVYIKPPEDVYERTEKYEESQGLERFLRDDLNPHFLEEGNYERVSGLAISATEAMGGETIDFDAVSKNCDVIIENLQLPVKVHQNESPVQ